MFFLQSLQLNGVRSGLSLPTTTTRKFGETMIAQTKLEEVSESEDSTDSEHDKVSQIKKNP